MAARVGRLPQGIPRIDFSALPAVRALCWLVAGLLLGLGNQAGLPGARPIGLAMVVAIALVDRDHGSLGLVLLALAGIALVRLHMAAPWRTYPQHLPRRVCRVWLRGVVATPSSPGGSRPRIVLRVTDLRTWREQSWQTCRGAVQVELPKETPAPAYGNRVELAGTLAPVDAAPAGALFDYSRHLWKRGIVDQVTADTIAEYGRDPWRAPLAATYRLRARLAAALVQDVRDPREQEVLQAMTLGYRRGLAPETRERFLRSSAIHVFAISGLHVGIVAMLCTWALALLGVPFRPRSLLLVPLVGGYVLMCGGAVSAVRAWLMLSCWWGSRVLKRPRVPPNAIAVAALLALLWRPLVLLETGFLFSFLVVGALVAGWPLAADLVASLGERRWWLPPASRPGRAARWRLLPARSLAVSSLAWLGSAGMVGASNGLLVPAGVLLNLGVVALCLVLLTVATVKIAVSAMGWQLLSSLGAWILGALVQGLFALTALAELPGASFRISPLPAALAAAYYGLLFAALVQRPLGHRRLLLFATCGLALLAPTLASRCSAASDHVLAGDGSALPAVLFRQPMGLPPAIVNTGGSRGARRLQALLERRGTGELEALVFSAASHDACGGAASLLARWPVRTLVVPASFGRSPALARAVASQRAEGGRVRVLPAEGSPVRLGPRQFGLRGQRFCVSAGHPPEQGSVLELHATRLGPLQATLSGPAGTERWTVPLGNAPVDIQPVLPPSR